MPESPLNQFMGFLGQRGKRLTSDSRLVAEIVFILAPPFDADAVFVAVGQFTSQHRVSRSTVYRTLSDLVQSGLVSIQSSENTKSVYFHSFAPPQAETLLSLCASTHSKLIVGTCPWCGHDIIRGKLRDDSE